MENGKDIEKIVLHYTDGSIQTVNKGFICDLIPSDDDETYEITFRMVHISGDDLSNMIEGVVELGLKLGMFGGNDDA
ncbi:MAG: hypothetical protein E7572_07190 [Ruminococcaceae bacterium]|jgi:hypothetical protein|nr:hypothetical protein [Oscillospiraceae bacterium]